MYSYYTFFTKARHLLFACLFLLLAAACGAQSITGMVTNSDKKPVIAASVLLLKATDSTLVKGTMSSATGNFSFPGIPPGNYTLQISFSGFEDTYSSVVVKDNISIDLGNFQLKEVSKQLEKVTVTTKRPLFEQRIDRMIVNVRSSITASGSTVLDVLERSPGIVVDRQNNSISMNGKDGVMVMINGKLNRMPLSALVQMLAGMNASNVEKIELITTPPANFDAEGNAGYINLVLISNPNQGFNGSYSLTMGYGRGETPAASINFNYRHNKTNLYGDYSYSLLHTKQLFTNYRKVDYQGDVIENYVENDRNTFQRNHNVRLGLDYEINKKTVMGLLMAAYNNKWHMDAENELNKTVNNVPDSFTTITNDEINHWKHYMADLNLQHNFKAGQTLSFDINYLWYNDNNPTNYTNRYYNAQHVFLSSDLTKSTKLTPINFWVGTADYTTSLNKKWKMQTGIKATISRFTNDVGVERFLQNVWVKDQELTGKYHLKENIGAAYASFDGDINTKTSVKIGLRYEYTKSNLGSTVKANIVDRKYGRLFPTFFLNRKLDDNNSMNLSYSRRINRPTFNEMAPFVIFMDPNTFFAGNSAIQPSITNMVKMDYLYKSYVFSVSYNIETETIARFQTEVDVSSNKQYFKAQNLDKTKLLNVSLSLPFTITKWWSMQNNFIGSWKNVKAVYKNEPIEISQLGLVISHAQTFRLPKDYAFELTGFYVSPGLFGISRIKAIGSLDVGLQKKIGKKGGSLRFAVGDLLQTEWIRVYTDQPEQHFYTRSNFRFAYRTFRLTWSCPFGNKELKDKRARRTGAEEESGRVQ